MLIIRKLLRNDLPLKWKLLIQYFENKERFRE